MSSNESNIYSTPEANLVSNHEGDHPVLNYKRFSAWAVFGLSVITMGYYAYYWMLTRTTTTNLLAEKKFNKAFIYIALVLAISSTGLTYGGGGSPELAIAGTVLSLIGGVFYIYSIFAMRNRIRDIINTSSSLPVKLGGIKTSFFGAIFLQYKINEAIDLQTAITAANDNINAASSAPAQKAA